MNHRAWGGLMASAVLAGAILTGCGTASGNMSNSTGSSMSNSTSMSTTNNMTSSSNSMGSGTATPTGSTKPLNVGDILIGAATSPAMGNGNGMLLMEPVKSPMKVSIPLANNANAFRIALVGGAAYVPTLQGKTYVVNLKSHQVTASFASPKGARVATASQTNHLLLITGSNSVTAYSLPAHKQVWQLGQGGSTLAIVGNSGYLSGTKTKTTQIIDLKTGKVTASIPVGMIEDSVYDKQQHTLWLANWSSGNMTIVDTKNNKVLKTVHETEGGGFTMNNMMASSSGFMQLAVGPKGNHVYAASFSGNIMVYNAMNNTFQKDIATLSGAKLSGIGVDPSGMYAYTTVENKQETIAVSLVTDKIVSTYPNVESNRWFVMQ